MMERECPRVLSIARDGQTEGPRLDCRAQGEPLRFIPCFDGSVKVALSIPFSRLAIGLTKQGDFGKSIRRFFAQNLRKQGFGQFLDIMALIWKD